MPKINYPSIENEQNKLQTSLTFVTQYFFPKVWLDYARVIVSALWKRLDQESIVKNKAKVSSPFFYQFSLLQSHTIFAGGSLNDQPKLGACQVHNRASLQFALVIIFKTDNYFCDHFYV